jgi:4-hydroxy-3-methylbut-2-enyl diphosphate reductase
VAEATRERFPELWMPGRSDLCFATTNRQSALMEMAPRCDAVVVVGSANSSNTLALEKLARGRAARTGVPGQRAEELPGDLAGVVGRDRRRLGARGTWCRGHRADSPRSSGVEEVRITEEDEYFPPPRALREMRSAIELIAGLGFGRIPGDHVDADRRLPASAVLEALT